MCRLISPRWSWREGSERSMIRSREVYPLAVIYILLWAEKEIQFWTWSSLVLQYPLCWAQMPLSPVTKILCSLENSRNKNSPFVPQCMTVLTPSFKGLNLNCSSMTLNKCQTLAPPLQFFTLNADYRVLKTSGVQKYTNQHLRFF